MDLQIAGRTALVTGASAGIGTGIAECLAREGVRLALAGRSASALDAVGKRVTGLGGPAPVLISADIATTEGVAQVATAALDAFGGRVDFLINNAGGSRPLTGAETEEFWQEALDLNFQSARRLTARIEPGMREARSGRIINVTGAGASSTSPARSSGVQSMAQAPRKPRCWRGRVQRHSSSRPTASP
jgi:3-oxoacyl-[acyl-carrier protein] reductase